MSAMLRAAAPVDVLPVMEQERAEFVRFLESLTAEDAGTPTICDGWTVGDIAVHLLGGDLSFLSRNRDRKESKLEDRAGGWDDLVSGLDALNESWVSGGRFLSTRLTAELLEVTGRAGFSWAVRRDAEGWKLYEGLSREATTRLTLDQDTAWRFLMRMATSADTRPKVAIDGDPAYAKPFFDAVSAIVRRT
jgi:hypothetical protein